MFLKVNRLLIQIAQVLFALIRQNSTELCFVASGCFVTIPHSTTVTVSGRFYRSISQASCLGLIFIDVNGSSKTIKKIYVFKVMTYTFWHNIFTLTVHLKNNPKNL